MFSHKVGIGSRDCSWRAAITRLCSIGCLWDTCSLREKDPFCKHNPGPWDTVSTRSVIGSCLSGTGFCLLTSQLRLQGFKLGQENKKSKTVKLSSNIFHNAPSPPPPPPPPHPQVLSLWKNAKENISSDYFKGQRGS